jgi:ankyrin repeat protein
MWMNLLFCLLIIYPSSEAKPQRVKRATSAERQLIRASKDNDIGEVRDLLNQRTDVDAADSDQWTALHWAAAKGHTEIVSLLLEKGANVNVQDKDGWTPIFGAATWGRTDVVSLLLENRADPNIPNKYGETPILRAAGNGHTDVVSLLLTKGANVNAQDKWGKTPIFYAARYGYKETARILQDNNADPRIKVTSGSNEGKSACDYNSSVRNILRC